MNDKNEIREQVKDKYRQAALRVTPTEKASCCGGGGSCTDPITTGLYSGEQAALIPELALQASLGCGNPTALAELKEGETVLDLGSGGGIDVLLSAKRVGPTGFAYGLDMTDEMLALAEQNKRKSGLTNVEFLKGHIEDIPLPDGKVDVLISNCVINLSGDKPQVIKEAFRVLKSGGRFAVSDVVVEKEVPEAIKADMEAYAGCISGALRRDEYIAYLQEAGFKDITITPTRIYSIEDMESALQNETVASLTEQQKKELEGMFFSAFIRATKP